MGSLAGITVANGYHLLLCAGSHYAIDVRCIIYIVGETQLFSLLFTDKKTASQRH